MVVVEVVAVVEEAVVEVATMEVVAEVEEEEQVFLAVVEMEVMGALMDALVKMVKMVLVSEVALEVKVEDLVRAAREVTDGVYGSPPDPDECRFTDELKTDQSEKIS